jgi:hypothetical protein
MPLSVAQTTAFFEAAAQMGIPNVTVFQLQEEGITAINNLSDFDKDTIEQIAANLRRPAGRIPDPNPAAAAFSDYLHRVIGVCTIPLAYVIRPEAAVPPIGPQAAGAPHSTAHEAIKTEIIARASHGHPLLREDNLAVYYKLEEATRATSYAVSIKPFQRAKNGRDA